jgi:hypothetical protein
MLPAQRMIFEQKSPQFSIHGASLVFSNSFSRAGLALPCVTFIT